MSKKEYPENFDKHVESLKTILVNAVADYLDANAGDLKKGINGISLSMSTMVIFLGEMLVKFDGLGYSKNGMFEEFIKKVKLFINDHKVCEPYRGETIQ